MVILLENIDRKIAKNNQLINILYIIKLKLLHMKEYNSGKKELPNRSKNQEAMSPLLNI